MKTLSICLLPAFAWTFSISPFVASCRRSSTGPFLSSWDSSNQGGGYPNENQGYSEQYNVKNQGYYDQNSEENYDQYYEQYSQQHYQQQEQQYPQDQGYGQYGDNNQGYQQHPQESQGYEQYADTQGYQQYPQQNQGYDQYAGNQGYQQQHQQHQQQQQGYDNQGYPTDQNSQENESQGLVLNGLDQEMSKMASKYSFSESDYLAAARKRAEMKLESANSGASDEDWHRVAQQKKQEYGNIDDWEKSAKEAGNSDSQILMFSNPPADGDDEDGGEPKLLLF